MKKMLIGAAAGAFGALGTAGLLTAAPASAQECGSPPFGITPGNIVCNVQENGRSFFMSVSPGYNLGVLLNGTEDSPELGLLDQPATFVRSVGDFFGGPQAPGGPPAVDDTDPGTPPA